MEAYLVAVAIQICIYLLLTLGLNLHYGYTGLINFGHVAFYCIGAYAVGLIGRSGWLLPFGLAGAFLIAALASLLIGALTLRLRAEFLAIVTLGFGETVRLVVLNEHWLTNGTGGLFVYQPFANIGVLQRELVFLAALLAIAAIVVLAVQRLATGPFGRLMRAIRDSEESVRAVGKTPVAVKARVLMLGAGLAGLAGALQATYIGFISPDQFTADVTFLCWMAMIIGGTGRVGGSVLGSIVLFGMFEGSRLLYGVVPGVTDVQIAYIRLAVIGLLLVLFTRYRPSGLLPERA